MTDYYCISGLQDIYENQSKLAAKFRKQIEQFACKTDSQRM